MEVYNSGDDTKQIALKMGFDPTVVEDFFNTMEKIPQQTRQPEEIPTNTVNEQGAITNTVQIPMGNEQSPTMLPGSFPVTQPFGNRSSVEKYSGGVNLGVDLAVPQGTKIAAPPGKWKVVEVSPGFSNGSGNLLKIQNIDTGEVLGFEHLSGFAVGTGQMIDGGTIIGMSGGAQQGAGRGNSTGSHVSIPYQDSTGKYRDFMQSPYAKYLYK